VNSHALRPVLSAFVIGLAAASLCVWLKTPLPWIIGPLFATAIARMAGLDLRCPVPFRQAGQWAIGTALGLYFTPSVIAILVSYIGVIALAVAFALLLGAACGWLLHKISGVDKTTAFFAMALGGASEMSVQGEVYGANVERVAAAHSMRIMLVVAVIPLAFRLWDVHGMDAFVPGTRDVNYAMFPLLVLVTGIAGALLNRIRLPNAWIIGPLATAIALTAFRINLSAMPEWIVHCGQLFIGVALGTRFTPTFLHTAPKYLATVALCTCLAVLLAAGFGYSLAWFSDIHPATAILATSPGGIAEMSLTAKNLQLGVPIVTAFHVTRVAALLILIGPMFRLVRRVRRRQSGDLPGSSGAPL
jgi:membrane AbrB-like protein